MKINSGPHSDEHKVVIDGVQHNISEDVSKLIMGISRERDEFYYLLEEVSKDEVVDYSEGLSYDLHKRIKESIKTQREFRKTINDNN